MDHALFKGVSFLSGVRFVVEDMDETVPYLDEIDMTGYEPIQCRRERKSRALPEAREVVLREPDRHLDRKFSREPRVELRRVRASRVANDLAHCLLFRHYFGGSRAGRSRWRTDALATTNATATNGERVASADHRACSRAAASAPRP